MTRREPGQTLELRVTTLRELTAQISDLGPAPLPECMCPWAQPFPAVAHWPEQTVLIAVRHRQPCINAGTLTVLWLAMIVADAAAPPSRDW